MAGGTMIFGCLVVGPALLVMDIFIGAKPGKGVGECCLVRGDSVGCCTVNVLLQKMRDTEKVD